jgi:hypothetical protein
MEKYFSFTHKNLKNINNYLTKRKQTKIERENNEKMNTLYFDSFINLSNSSLLGSGDKLRKGYFILKFENKKFCSNPIFLNFTVSKIPLLRMLVFSVESE